jgi:hypothetical protein
VPEHIGMHIRTRGLRAASLAAAAVTALLAASLFPPSRMAKPKEWRSPNFAA